LNNERWLFKEVLMGVAERKEREKEQRRSAIVDAAEEVFFSKGLENATMDEVAEKAELSKGTLYIYFKNKNDLFHAIVARALEMLFNIFQCAVEKEEKGIDKIKAIGTAYFEFYKTNPDYYSAMLHQEVYEIDHSDVEENPNIALCQQLGGKIFGLMREGVKTGIMDGTIRKDLDPVKLPIVLWGHAAGVLHLVKSKGKMLEEKFDCSCEGIIEYSAQLIRQYMENKK
jgi:AcrR family transcriptional regulator